MTKEDLKEKEMKKTIGMRFKQFREFIKMSQAELAEELQVSEIIISDIETGKIFPGFPVQNYLFNRFQLDINWLTMGSGKMLITPEEKSASDHVRKIISHMDENNPMYEIYAVLEQLMKDPIIELFVIGKLAEIKILASKEIKALISEAIPENLVYKIE